MALKTLAALLSAAGMAIATNAFAEDYVITLKDHQFTPRNLVLPAGQKLKVKIANQQPGAAEFESADLTREKVVQGNSEIWVNLGPLDPGTYKYFDDFHHDSSGSITVK